jgi:probable F420-dependent oxidoreductase
MSKLGVSMPILNQPMEAFPRMAAAADDAGFDSVWDYEFYRNPFVIHAMTARETSRIQLATGLATTANRTPFEMANAAADIDEISCGRALVGLGIGAAGFAEIFHGADVDHPAARLREFIGIMRLGWEYLDTGKSAAFEGDYYRFGDPPFNPWGRRALTRPEIPIYLAALRPTMLKVAGEIADGVIGYMMTPKYLDEVVLPNVAAGAKRAGRDPHAIDVASETICSVSTDRAEAYRRARIQVGTYAAYPVSEPLVDILGLRKERLDVLDALMREGPGCLERVVDNKLVDALAIAGTPDECRRKLAEYEGRLPHIILHTPYVPPLTQEDSADAYHNIITTFGQ